MNLEDYTEKSIILHSENKDSLYNLKAFLDGEDTVKITVVVRHRHKTKGYPHYMILPKKYKPIVVDYMHTLL